MSGTPDPRTGASIEPDAKPSASEADSAAGSGPGRRRYPIVPAALLTLGAAALWGASRLTWVTIVSSDGLTESRAHRLDGGVWFGALTPLALVLLAAILAALSTRGVLRRLVGVVIAVLAAVAAVPAFAMLGRHGRITERAATLAELPARAHIDQVSTATGPAVLTLAGAVAAFAAGVLLARMSETTARLSGKYDNPVFRRAAAAREVTARRDTPVDSGQSDSGKSSSEAGIGPDTGLSERVLWDALDAGADPTEDGPGK